MSRSCSVPSCDAPHHANGYCKVHCLRVYRHGSTAPLRGGTLEERFWRNVDRHGDDECWEWKPRGGKYGVMRHPGRVNEGAHRVSYRIHHGEVPAGLFVLHSCDNPRCVNPAHLRAGTPKENMADMDARGRRVIAYAKGEKSSLAVLNEHAVRFIRLSELKTADLARIFGLTHQAIHAVRIRKSWKHVD